jgi:hypothetical protein
MEPMSRLLDEAHAPFDACAPASASPAELETRFHLDTHVDATGHVSAASVTPQGPTGECLRKAALGLRIDNPQGIEDDVPFDVHFERDANGKLSARYNSWRTTAADEAAEYESSCAAAPDYGDEPNVPEPRVTLSIVVRNRLGSAFRFRTACLLLDGKRLFKGTVLGKANEALADGRPVTWRGPVTSGKPHKLSVQLDLVGRTAPITGYGFVLRASRVVGGETRVLELVLFEQGGSDVPMDERPSLRMNERAD